MTQQIIKHATPGGIGAGQQATLNLPTGWTYHTIMINMRAGSEAANVGPVTDWGSFIDDIRLKVSGDVTIDIKAADLVKLNAYYGHPSEPGILPLILTRRQMQTIEGQNQTAYKTKGISSFTIEIELKNNIVIDDLSIYSEVGPGLMWGSYLEIKNYSVSQGLQGTAEIDGISTGQHHLYAAHLMTDKIGKVETHAANMKLTDASPSVRAITQKLMGRVPQQGMTSCDYTSLNRGHELLPMAVNDYRIKADITEPLSQTLKIYTEALKVG